MKKIGIICGSLRKYSYNKALMNSMIDQKLNHWEVEIIHIDDMPLYNFDIEGKSEPESVTIFRNKIQEMDGLIIVSPEYNLGIPGVLKNAIDWASRVKFKGEKSPLINKPFAISGGSPGNTGSSLGQMQIRQSLLAMDAQVMSGPKIIVSKIHEKVDDEGLLINDERTNKHIFPFLKSFDQWMDLFI